MDYSFPLAVQSETMLGPGLAFSFGGHVPQLYKSATDPTNRPRDLEATERLPELADAWAKIENARFHLRRFFKAYSEAFGAKRDYIGVEWKDGPEAGICRCYAWLDKSNTTGIAAIFGDYVHNLRSCLDYLAWTLVVHAGGTPDTSTMFPLTRDLGRGKETFPERRVQGMSEDAKLLIKALQPTESSIHRDTQHALGLLEHLDLADKHRSLALVGAAVAETQGHIINGCIEERWERRLVVSHERQLVLTLIVTPPEALSQVELGFRIQPCMLAAHSGAYVAAPDFEVLGQAVLRVVALVTTHMQGGDALS